MAACGFTHFDSPNLWISNLEVHILSINPEQKVGFLAPKPWPNASFLKDLMLAYMSSFQLHLNPRNLKSSCERLGGYRLPSVEPGVGPFFWGEGRPCSLFSLTSRYTNWRFAVSKILFKCRTQFFQWLVSKSSNFERFISQGTLSNVSVSTTLSAEFNLKAPNLPGRARHDPGNLLLENSQQTRHLQSTI